MSGDPARWDSTAPSGPSALRARPACWLHSLGWFFFWLVLAGILLWFGWRAIHTLF